MGWWNSYAQWATPSKSLVFFLLVATHFFIFSLLLKFLSFLFISFLKHLLHFLESNSKAPGVKKTMKHLTHSLCCFVLHSWQYFLLNILLESFRQTTQSCVPGKITFLENFMLTVKHVKQLWVGFFFNKVFYRPPDAVSIQKRCFFALSCHTYFTSTTISKESEHMPTKGTLPLRRYFFA